MMLEVVAAISAPILIMFLMLMVVERVIAVFTTGIEAIRSLLR